MYSRISLSVTIVAILVFFSGCASQTKIVKYGNIATPQVMIEAVDGSFSIASGKQFAPPFHSDTSKFKIHTNSSNIVEEYKDALEKHGAKRVRISVKGHERDFHGILLLSNIYENGVGPATRSYQIQLPPMYIEAAKGGKISVVYEMYERKRGGKAKSWVLWISDIPFDV